MNKSKYTKKQRLKRTVDSLLVGLTKSLVNPEEAANMTVGEALAQWPKVSYFKDDRTGEIRVGLSRRGVRKLVKKYPNIQVPHIRIYFGLDQ